MSTERVKLVVAYDGYDFCGWASQYGQRTVHSTLREGIRRVAGRDVLLTGASRTDSGAHARGQVCHFDDLDGVPVGNWARALNDVLPNDVAVVSAVHTAPGFHSRFCAHDRWYRYRIKLGHRDPSRSRYVHTWAKPLDLAAMQEAAERFVGEHDFRVFGTAIEGYANTVRVLRTVKVDRVQDEIRLDVVGTAFIRGMMRRIAGALLEVGRGKRNPEDISRLLLTQDRSTVRYPVTLPAHGLCLMRVRYGRHPFDIRLRGANDKTDDDNQEQDNEE